MVQLEIKTEGQRGHMVLQEDGTIIASTGELASQEAVSQQIVNLISHSLPVDFKAVKKTNGNGEGSSSGQVNTAAQDDNGIVISQPVNGSTSGSDDAGKTWKWNRVTVRFPEYSYVACLSNRKIHVVKRNNNIDPPPVDEPLIQTS